jgi:hypothetical protein
MIYFNFRFPEETENTQSGFAGKILSLFTLVLFIVIVKLKQIFLLLVKYILLPEADCVTSLSSGKRCE